MVQSHLVRLAKPSAWLCIAAIAFSVFVQSTNLKNTFRDDDFMHLYDLVDHGFFTFVSAPHGGHVLVAHKAVIGLLHKLCGLDPLPYFALALGLHALCVSFLFRVIFSISKRSFLAAFLAGLWGTSPIHQGVVGWISVFGQLFATTAILWVLADVVSVSREERKATAWLQVRWSLLLLIAATSFGSGLALVVLFPVIVCLIARPGSPLRRVGRRLSIVSAIAILLLAVSGFASRGSWSDWAPVFGWKGAALTAVLTPQLVILQAGYGFSSLFLGPLTTAVSGEILIGPFMAASPEQIAWGAGGVGALALLAVGVWYWRGSEAKDRGIPIASLLLVLVPGIATSLARALLYGSQLVIQERYHYLPMAGIAIFLGAVLPRFRFVGPAWFSGAVACVWFAVLVPFSSDAARQSESEMMKRNRDEIRVARAIIDRAIEEAGTSERVWIKNLDFPPMSMCFAFGVRQRDFPRLAAFYLPAYADDVDALSRVRFVESDTSLVEEIRSKKGRHSSEMIVSMAECQGVLPFDGSAMAESLRNRLRLRGQDGEGAAFVEPTGPFVAGSQATIRVTVEIGESGIPVGGGVGLGFHHGSDWPDLQIDSPLRPGFITVTGATPHNFELSWYPNWAPREIFNIQGEHTNWHDRMYHRSVFAKVVEEPLQPGERVQITLGAGKGMQVQTQTDANQELRVFTDVDGDGRYERLADVVPRQTASSPKVDIVAANPSHLVGSAPSLVVAGEEFELHLRAEDRHFNPVDGYAGDIVVRTDSGETIAQASGFTGVTTIPLTLNTLGATRLELSDGNLVGACSPIRVVAEQPKYRLYWGDLHGHSSFSDGLGDDADEYYTFARDLADLDVCALTDHGYVAWGHAQEAVRTYYEPGRFVTILGHEGPGGWGHMNLYFRFDHSRPLGSWSNAYDAFNLAVASQYDIANREVIVGPHHFTYNHRVKGQEDLYPFGAVDPRFFRFVELYSCHGNSEYLGNSRPLAGASKDYKFLQAGLASGQRFGVIASSDTHDSHPGRSRWGAYPGGLTAFLATGLTREEIWDAFWNYRVYATSFDRIYIDFSIDEAVIGEGCVTDRSCEIRYEVIGQTEEFTVELIKDNEVLRVDSALEGALEIKVEDSPVPGEHFYYLRVVQSNGEMGWTTPIWVTRT